MTGGMAVQALVWLITGRPETISVSEHLLKTPGVVDFSHDPTIYAPPRS
jgi:hypothetical protein